MKLGKSWFELERKLLSLGGTSVQPPYPGVLVRRLAKQGRPFGGPVLPRRGWRHECHRNSAEVWAQDVARYRRCHGYALTGEKWIDHSWVLDGEALIETTYRMEVYFGVVLSPEAAARSWFDNFLAQRYPGPTSLFEPIFHTRPPRRGPGRGKAAASRCCGPLADQPAAEGEPRGPLAA